MFAKKSVVAGAALLAMAAAAQAEVKIYGYLDASFGSYESFTGVGDGTDRVTAVGSGNMMTSFIGFAGSEDLGGGLKAEFALESFIANDTGSASSVYNKAGGFWGRASWVGLSGGFGRVILGQYDNAFFTFGYTYNPFGSSMPFSPTMVSFYKLTTDTVFPVGLGYDTGWVNSITYETPNFGGFTASLQYGPKESTSSADGNKNNFAISGAYNAGPLSVMAVYTNSGDNRTANQAYDIRQKNWGLGASYDFGVLKLQGQLAEIKSFTTATDDDAGKAKFFQIGATVPVTSAGNVLIAYGQTKYDDGFGGAPDGSKLRQISLGYDHSISKRTGAYVAFTNKKLSDFTIEDDTANTFAVGIRHSF